MYIPKTGGGEAGGGREAGAGGQRKFFEELRSVAIAFFCKI